MHANENGRSNRAYFTALLLLFLFVYYLPEAPFVFCGRLRAKYVTSMYSRSWTSFNEFADPHFFVFFFSVGR